MPRPRKKPKDEAQFLTPIDQYFAESGMAITDKYGEDYVSSALEEDANLKYLEVPDLGLQWSLGRKGFALGRIMQVMGFEGASKTSFALWVANLCMRSGGIAAMVETELASSTKHMLNYLERPEKFRIFHPESIEDALQITMDQLNLFLKIDPEGLIPKVLILDSIAGSTDARAMKDEENFTQAKVGGAAKIIKDATNLIKGKLRESNTLWVVLNQGRDLIQTGFQQLTPEIDKVIGTGGRAIPFAATYWLVLKRNAATKESGDVSGFKVKATFKKNKLGEPLRVVYYNIQWGETLDFTESTANLLALAEPSDENAVGGILGIQEAKGGKYYSDELGIPKTEAITAKEMYALAHSPGNYERCQEELGVVMSDQVLKYGKEANDADARRAGRNAGRAEESDAAKEGGDQALVPDEDGDTGGDAPE